MSAERSGTVWGFVYGLLCYAAFNASFAYFVLFTNDLLVPGVSQAPTHHWATAIAINLGLVLLWGLQHSVMARRRFKVWWTRIIPAHTERATYCLASALALAAICYFWSPLPGTVWDVETPAARVALHGLGVSAWLLLLAASFEIDHFELFGLKQTYFALRGRGLPPPAFQVKRIYRTVRHPIQTGVLFGLWATPTMGTSRLMFAATLTAYVFLGLYFEERDLVAQFGERYLRYMREVPKVIPGWSRPSRQRDVEAPIR